MTRLEKAQDYFKDSTSLDELLDEISVLPVNDMIDDFSEGEKMFELNTLLSGWFAVANQEGIIAYFGTQEEAFSYRLNFINRVLNN